MNKLEARSKDAEREGSKKRAAVSTYGIRFSKAARKGASKIRVACRTSSSHVVKMTRLKT